ncbi:MAG: phosphoenolpyruvate carboxykinase (ATP), partial [Marinicaulis sp.]|nr:phosphoenolpyruvate carboxykinase (ATP) [Marinicaulis sp.]
MKKTGVFNTAHDLEKNGIVGASAAYYNLQAAALYEYAVKNDEARISAHGPLVATTGDHTGRSVKDKFIVADGKVDEHIWWDNNLRMELADFDALHADMLAHAQGKELFVQDLIGGADANNCIKTRVITEKAWHSLFIRNLLICPERETLADFVNEMTIIDLPSFKANPAKYNCR